MGARVHNIEGRGIINKESDADIVLMELSGLKVKFNENEPQKYSESIEYV